MRVPVSFSREAVSPETAVCARSSVHRECSEHWANLAFRKKKCLNEELLDSDPCGALGHVVFFSQL